MTPARCYSNSHLDILSHEAAVPQEPRPELHADDAEDEEDKEAERQHVAQHGQRVQEEGDEDTHTYHTNTRSVNSEDNGF